MGFLLFKSKSYTNSISYAKKSAFSTNFFSFNTRFSFKMYSFIEILLVFIIIGVLSSLAFFAYRFSQTAVTDDLSRNVLNSVALAQREFYAQRGVWLTDPNLLSSYIPDTVFATPAVNPYDVSLVEEFSPEGSSLGIAVLTPDSNCLTLRVSPSGSDVSGSFVPSGAQSCSGSFA
jgi:type II secretory pathway pseudopilin PulG